MLALMGTGIVAQVSSGAIGGDCPFDEARDSWSVVRGI
jgi:hypothetical protein